MKNGDTILLRHKMVIEPVEVVDYTPADYDMDTIEDLQALVDQIQAEVPLPTVVRLNLPPVHSMKEASPSRGGPSTCTAPWMRRTCALPFWAR